MRRKVLADELAAEEKLLSETRVAYADGAPAPLAEERADAEKYRARIARLRQSLAVHERNVEALRRSSPTSGDGCAERPRRVAGANIATQSTRPRRHPCHRGGAPP